MCHSMTCVHTIDKSCFTSVSKFKNCLTKNNLSVPLLSFYSHYRLPQFKEEAKSFVGTNMKKVNIKDVLSD